jgi:tetratricopeptide (TPR) repeat protein
MNLLSINSSDKPTLCLNMIVKNESKIITRLFDSVLPIIDCYCICDTGSTDNTVKIITDYFSSKGVPGKVVFEPFKNFAHNRTFALQACVGLSDYVLLLDADMILEIKKFDKSLLKLADSFKILQGNENLHYQNMRIVRNNGLYKYLGVTHEYIDTPGNNTCFDMDKNVLFINDIGDGGAKSDKFERDIRLLTEGIKQEPNNVRYYFYLANSYHDNGKYELAIENYKKRIEFGGWKEEVWYSYYRIGSCYKNIGNFGEALNSWLNGFEFYPERLEALYEIIHYYRINSKNKLSYSFYEMAKKILDKNLDRSTCLFLHNDVYTYKLYYEYILFSYYNGCRNINDEVINVLNNCKDHNTTNNVLVNMKFYKDCLKPMTKVNLDNSVEINLNGVETKFYSTSSCIIQNPDKSKNSYLMNVRYVNYYINDEGRYLNCEKYIATTNKFIELDKNFNILHEKMFNLGFEDRLYVGVEDVRLFYDNSTNKMLFIGTGFHRNNKIAIVSGDYNLEKDLLEHKELKVTFANSDCEKNWVFVNYKNSNHIIYNWHPLNICKINENNNEIYSVEKREMPYIFSRARGSTCGFNYTYTKPLNNGGNISIEVEETEIWFVVHIVAYEQPRNYYHVIVVFDENLKLLRYSAPFKFEGECIEYCLGIVVEDDRVLMTYSTWDRTTRIGVYDKKYIDSIVKYN